MSTTIGIANLTFTLTDGKNLYMDDSNRGCRTNIGFAIQPALDKLKDNCTLFVSDPYLYLINALHVLIYDYDRGEWHFADAPAL